MTSHEVCLLHEDQASGSRRAIDEENGVGGERQEKQQQLPE